MRMMETVSRTQPRDKSTRLMPMKTSQRLNCTSVTSAISACGACSAVRMKPKSIAPIMMAKIIEVVLTVAVRISSMSRSFTVR